MAGLDIGLDLGTTSIMIYMSNKGVVLEEPSVVAINKRTNAVLAVGTEAYRMLGRTPDYIMAEAPLKNGVISDHHLTGLMIREFLRRVSANLMIKPRVAICIPSSITDIESRAVIDVAVNSGARRVYLIEEPIAAAIGAGIDITAPNGHLIVDIGGGTTDIAVISLNGIVTKDSIKIAGNCMNEAIVKYMSTAHKLLVGEKTAEQVKIQIGTVFSPSADKRVTVKGRNLMTGLPEFIEVTQEELYPVLLSFAMQIVHAVRAVLEKTPPELVGDIYSNGLLLTGGGSLLNGLDSLLAAETGVHVRHAENPLHCVAIGTGRVFEHLHEIRDGFSNAATYKH